MQVTFLGHACFQVQTSGKTLLFDPFLRANPKARPTDFDTVKPDVIFLSHGHADHVADAPDLAKKHGCPVVCNYEIANWLSKQGVTNAIGMNLGGTVKFDSISAKHVPAAHSSELPDGTYGGNPGGFVVRFPEGSFYYSGDTALIADMKLVADLGPFRFAVLCVGDHFTMGYEDAALAAEWLGVKDVLGVHYDTFPPIAINHQDAKAAFAKRNIALHLIQPGDGLTF
ncbi:MAG: metal-dependent hydrolase [Candidatus Methylacidiphilales bacterium]